MKKLPLSIQTFENIISGEMIYVDKTEFVHELISSGKYYFLSRPRRFGKSLLLTTLKAFFEGKKELFKGLYIYDKEQKWKAHPVIHIDYSLVEYKKSREVFEESLLNHLKNVGSDFGIMLKKSILADAFMELSKALFDKLGPVVVLVDEYDKPMVDMLTNEDRFEENREVLRSLYGAMKGLDAYFRFVMLTGVSRFSKVNVFSGLNNLTDISLSNDFNAILGFTQNELETYFEDWLEQVRQKFGITKDELLNEIKYKYNGFSWDGKTKLYNPFSILHFVNNREFRNYWFSSGTPNFLIHLIKSQKQLPQNLESIKMTDLEGSTTQIKKLPLVPILFQTGYLTIEKTELQGIRHIYFLNYPNGEVRESFVRYIAAAFVGKQEFEIQPEALKLRDALLEERTDDFLSHLQSFLADIPARLHIPKEAYFHSLVYLMLRLVGVQLLLEKETSRGRIDAVLELPDKIYIIEFKFAATNRIKRVKTLSRQALAQIESQKYYEPYLNSGKKIILFGIGYLNKKLDGRVVKHTRNNQSADN